MAKVSARQAAKLAGVDRKTMLGYCKRAINGQPSKIKNVQKTVTGRYKVDAAEARKLATKD